MPGSKPCGKLETAHHNERGNDGQVHACQGTRRGDRSVPLKPGSNEFYQVRPCLNEAQRSSQVKEVPAISAVVEIEKLKCLAFYEEICEAHIGMNEAKVLARLAVGSHSGSNACLCTLKKLPFLWSKRRKGTPVAPKGMGAKRRVAVPDGAVNGQFRGTARLSSRSKALVMLTRHGGSSKASCLLVQRSGEHTQATEETAHRFPICLVRSRALHICKDNAVKYPAVWHCHDLNDRTIQRLHRPDNLNTIKLNFRMNVYKPSNL